MEDLTGRSPEVKNLDGDTIIPAGKYESLKEALEQNKANLSRGRQAVAVCRLTLNGS